MTPPSPCPACDDTGTVFDLTPWCDDYCELDGCGFDQPCRMCRPEEYARNWDLPLPENRAIGSADEREPLAPAAAAPAASTPPTWPWRSVTWAEDASLYDALAVPARGEGPLPGEDDLITAMTAAMLAPVADDGPTDRLACIPIPAGMITELTLTYEPTPHETGVLLIPPRLTEREVLIPLRLDREGALRLIAAAYDVPRVVLDVDLLVAELELRAREQQRWADDGGPA